MPKPRKPWAVRRVRLNSSVPLTCMCHIQVECPFSRLSLRNLLTQFDYWAICGQAVESMVYPYCDASRALRLTAHMRETHDHLQLPKGGKVSRFGGSIVSSGCQLSPSNGSQILAVQHKGILREMRQIHPQASISRCGEDRRSALFVSLGTWRKGTTE